MMKAIGKTPILLVGALATWACSGDYDELGPSGVETFEEEGEALNVEQGDSDLELMDAVDDFEVEEPLDPQEGELTYDAEQGEGWASEDSEGSGETPERAPVEKGLFGSCGSTSTLANSVYNYTAVPDHFPPDSLAAHAAAAALGIPISASAGCLPFGIAHLHNTCDVHDACYGTLGKTRAECDSEAKALWSRTCKDTYDNIGTTDVVLGILSGGLTAPVSVAEQACRTACLAQADAMYGAISSFGQSAYDSAQRDASRPVIDPSGTGGPIFF